MATHKHFIDDVKFNVDYMICNNQFDMCWDVNQDIQINKHSKDILSTRQYDEFTRLGEQSIDNVIVKACPLVEGAGDYGPYDAVVIEGGITFVPDAIINQLKLGGRIVAIFMNGSVGECQLGFRSSDGINWRFGFNAAVPLLNDFRNETEFVL